MEGLKGRVGFVAIGAYGGNQGELFYKAGYPVAGFDMYVTSTVLPGSGLSSSAACEVLIGTTGNHLFCQDKFDAVEIAKSVRQQKMNILGNHVD